MNQGLVNTLPIHLDARQQTSPLAKSAKTRNSTTGSSLNIDNEEQQTFESIWNDISTINVNIEVEKYKINEKENHYKSEDIVKNVEKSITKKQNKGIIYYLIYDCWISYLDCKYNKLIWTAPNTWVTEFTMDIQDLQKIVLELLSAYYRKQGIKKNKDTLLSLLSDIVTKSKQWVRINNIFNKIMSRNKYRLSQNKNVSTQTFELNIQEFQEPTFEKQISSLKQLHNTPSIKKKIQMLDLFETLIGKKFYPPQIQRAIQYCLLKTRQSGFNEMFKYVALFCEQGKTKDFIQKVLNVPAERLETRDCTGFTNFKFEQTYHQASFERQSWKYLYSKRSTFNFTNHLTVSHKQSTWQTLISWNYLNPNCQLPLAINIDNNFLELGIIKDCHDDMFCKDYSNSDKIISYCFFSGILSNCKQQLSQHKPIPNVFSKVSLNISQNKITWYTYPQNKQKTKVAQIKIDNQILPNSRIIIMFKRGMIKAFPN